VQLGENPMTRRKERPPEQVTLARRRFYRLADGTELPSVTTVLGIALAKPALPGWAAKTVATEALDNLPRLVRMSRTNRDEAIRWLKGSPYSQRDAAADAGSKAHDLAEAHALGKPYTAPDTSTDLGETLTQFVKWMADWQPTFEATEAIVTNLTVGWAGTLDAICRIPALDNRLLVVDYKTGKTGPYPEWALQVGGAYANAEHLWLPDGTSVPMPKVDGAMVLRLRPDFYAMHMIDADLSVLANVFTHTVRLAEWAQDANQTSPFGPVVKPAEQRVLEVSA
jgi:hypothetical protein